jgi:expansin (peptidoglycan-binding protein)
MNSWRCHASGSAVPMILEGFKMKRFSAAKKYGARFAVSAVLLIPLMAHADVTAVTTAITAVGTDAATEGGAVLTLMVVIASFLWLRKPIR